MVNDKDTAYVFWKESNISKKLMSYLINRSISYESEIIDNDIVIYSLSQKIDPVKALTPCNWINELG